MQTSNQPLAEFNYKKESRVFRFILSLILGMCGTGLVLIGLMYAFLGKEYILGITMAFCGIAAFAGIVEMNYQCIIIFYADHITVNNQIIPLASIDCIGFRYVGKGGKKLLIRTKSYESIELNMSGKCRRYFNQYMRDNNVQFK